MIDTVTPPRARERPGLVPHLIGEGATLAEVRAQTPAAGQTVDRGPQVSLTMARITDRSLADRMHN